MIKTLLCYAIGEAAIKTLFDKVSVNFNTNNRILVPCNQLIDEYLGMYSIINNMRFKLVRNYVSSHGYCPDIKCNYILAEIDYQYYPRRTIRIDVDSPHYVELFS